MASDYDLIIRGATIVNHAGRAVADVAVSGGRTAAIGDLARSGAEREIDARGLHLLPGAIDTQVHFREPGNAHKEDLATGSRAAVMGGITAVFEMPNTAPPTTSAAALADKLERAAGRMLCDHAFYLGASEENAQSLAELEARPGCAGIKVFMGSSTGNLLVAEDTALAAVLASGRRRVAVHAEDEARLEARKTERVPGDPASHATWRDAETALAATKRILALARRAGRRVHILHVSTAEEMALLAENKDIASVETTPQHLTLAAPECYERLGSYVQMNPPIREAGHREGLWMGVAAGTVDVIGSDHAPHTHAEKDRGYPESPSGMPGVQTLLPLLLTHAGEGRLSLERVVDLTSHGPARLFNLRDKGRLAAGFHADYSLVDLKARWRVDDSWIASKCGWSPFTGMEMTGRPVATILRGRPVMLEGEVDETAIGQPIRFQETIAPES